MSHIVLVWPQGDCDVIVRESKWSRPGPHSIGPTRRRSMCEKDCARAKMERVSGLSVIVLESENRNKGILHQKRVMQRRKSLTHWGRSDKYRESRTTLTCSSLPDTLQTTALSSSPLLIHVVTTDIYLHISRYSSAWSILCACVFLV